jgi:hypothetical protein
MAENAGRQNMQRVTARLGLLFNIATICCMADPAAEAWSLA